MRTAARCVTGTIAARSRSAGRVPVERPRARSADGEHEVELGTYAHFAARDRLSDVMLERMLAGVSTRRYARTGDRGRLRRTHPSKRHFTNRRPPLRVT